MLKKIDKRLRKLLLNLYLYRDGYQSVMANMREFQKFSRLGSKEIERLTLNRLKWIAKHAFETTEYYREVWDNNSYDWHTFRKEGFSNYPILTKQDIEENRQRMYSNIVDRKDCDYSHTGGSSGTPTLFLRDKECTAARMGRQWGILESCGYSPGEKRALIWGAHQDLSSKNERRTYRHDLRKYASADEILCCTIVSDLDLYDYYKRLHKFRASILYGYPSAMVQFADFIRKKNLRPIKFDKIISTAERLAIDQRLTLSQEFCGEVYNLYCTREHGCIGFECNKHNGFHIDTGSVYLEIIADDGKNAQVGEIGNIVTTDLLNKAMPFIRYNIGDRGSLSIVPCECGCRFPLLSRLEGRVSDLIYRTDGSEISGVMLIDLFIDEPLITKFQIVQHTLKKIEIIMVVKDGFNEDCKHRIIGRMRTYLTEDVEISISLVDEIPRNPLSGKHQEVISKIKL